jgi:hypothetical protein
VTTPTRIPARGLSLSHNSVTLFGHVASHTYTIL